MVTDVTSGLGVLSVTGPRSRELLAGLTEADLSDAGVPVRHAPGRSTWAGRRCSRCAISFAGELGWELYAPVESLPVLYDQLVAAGAELGLRHAGYHALDGLRAEKGYLHWGADAGPADTPYEAGLGVHRRDGQARRLHRPRGAASRAGPPRRRLVPILLADPEPLLYHGESRAAGRARRRPRHLRRLRPHARRGRRARRHRRRARRGRTRSSAAGDVEVEIAGTRAGPRASRARPFYDPDGRRLRGA